MSGANIVGAVAAAFVLMRLFMGPNPLKIIYLVEDLPMHPTKVYPTRSLDGILRHVIHHVANHTWDVFRVAQFHVEDRGWPGIGYHFFIDKAGNVYQTNYLETLSYHVAGKNTTSIGYCLQGNLEESPPTAAQLDSLVKTIQFVNTILGRALPVDGHRDHSPTACPGAFVDVQAIEDRVYQNVA